MTVTRVSSLGLLGSALLLLSACSAPSASATRAGEANAQNERVDSTSANQNQTSSAKLLSVLDVPKWVNVLEKPPHYAFTEHRNEQGVVDRQDYEVSVRQATAQMLPPGLPATPVFAYAGLVTQNGSDARVEYQGSPGATFEMTRGIPARVAWKNEISTPYFLPVDRTLHWANPNNLPMTANFPAFPDGDLEAQKTVPYVTHVHGLEVASIFDGGPESWFTQNGLHGPKFLSSTADYPNSQPATALWYHDHALGVTRLNVYAGLAGMYIIRDPKNSIENPANGQPVLPSGDYEMPLVIQDRSFNSDGTLAYINSGDDPSKHPYWGSYFSGDFNLVNGKVWPEMKVNRGVYRFRVLNGANNRSYTLSLSDQRAFTVIGSDGGFLAAPVSTTTLTLAPAERADVLIDFSNLDRGSSVILGDADQSEVLRFTVPADAQDVTPLAALPNALNTIPTLTPNAPKRTVTLNAGDDGSYLLDGQMFDAAVSETPRVGATEDWDIVNISDMDHPIHLHLVQFQIVQRRPFREQDYRDEWTRLNGSTPLANPTQKVDADPYLTGDPTLPAAAEAGWKDTVIASAGAVTRIRIRWAPQEAPHDTAPGDNAFGFDPTSGPGYLFHCHMLEHEDNEMMRPVTVRP